MSVDPQSLEEFYLLKAPPTAGLIWQLTAPRTIMAVLVLLFSVCFVYLVVAGSEVPDFFSQVVMLAVGSFFRDLIEDSQVVRRIVGQNASAASRSAPNGKSGENGGTKPGGSVLSA